MFQTTIAAGFQSVWYWLLSAVLWGQVCHRILAVPHDMLRGAARDPAVAADVDRLAGIAAERFARLNQRLGVPAAAAGGFGIAVLAVVGFVYKVESAQAAFILAFPLAGVWLGTLRLVLALRSHDLRGEALQAALLRRRRWNLTIAIVSLLAAMMMGLAHHPDLLLR